MGLWCRRRVKGVVQRVGNLLDSTTYTVKFGDTFNQIAYDNNMTPKELKNLNPNIKNTSVIDIGNIINLTNQNKVSLQSSLNQIEPNNYNFQQDNHITSFSNLESDACFKEPVSIDRKVYSQSEQIAKVALKYKKSENWSYIKSKGAFGKNTNKCNLFVYDVLSEININLPLQDQGFSTYIPFIGEENMPYTAGQWADPSLEIPGFKIVSSPKIGDIIAIAMDYADATGHVGIITGNKQTTLQSSKTDLVETNDWGFREDQQAVYRRYIKE
jgi:hypothetical protein